MKQNWILLAAIFAVLAVPFAIAAFEDATAEAPEPDPAISEDVAPLAPIEIVETLDPEDGAARGDSGDDGVAAFERRQPLDLSFLDLLASDRPGLGPELVAAAPFGKLDTERLEALADRYDGSRSQPTLALDRLADGRAAALEFRFAAEAAVRDALELRWGEPDLRDRFGVAWVGDGAGGELRLRVSVYPDRVVIDRIPAQRPDRIPAQAPDRAR